MTASQSNGLHERRSSIFRHSEPRFLSLREILNEEPPHSMGDSSHRHGSPGSPQRGRPEARQNPELRLSSPSLSISPHAVSGLSFHMTDTSAHERGLSPPPVVQVMSPSDLEMFQMFRPPRPQDEDNDNHSEILPAPPVPVHHAVSSMTVPMQDSVGPGLMPTLGDRRQSFQCLYGSPLTNEFAIQAPPPEKERRPTWLELFYDLFFVAILRILSHSQIGFLHLFGDYAAIFTIVWWTWMMVTLYDSKYDTDDIYHRLGKLVQMLAIGGFALTVENVFVNVLAANLFAGCYIAIRFVLFLNYSLALYFAWIPQRTTVFSTQDSGVRTFAAQEETPEELHARRKLAGRRLAPLLLSNFLAIVLVACSTALGSGKLYYRIIIWALSCCIDAGAHVFVTWRLRQVPFRGSHLPERLGLFTIIVVGEDVIGVLVEAAERVSYFLQHPTNANVFDTWGYPCLLLVFFVIISYCWWWMYFDDISNCSAEWGKRQKRVYLYDTLRHIWIYMHLPLHLLLSLLGVTMVSAIRLAPSIASVQIAALVNSNIIVLPSASLEQSGADPSSTTNMPLKTITLTLFALTGALHLFSALIKVMNTYQNDATVYDRIGYTVRVSFGIVFFICLIIPLTSFENLQNEPLTMVYILVGLGMCTVLQVVCDVWVVNQNSQALFHVLVRTFSDSGANLAAKHHFNRTMSKTPADNTFQRHKSNIDLRGPHRPAPAAPTSQMGSGDDLDLTRSNNNLTSDRHDNQGMSLVSRVRNAISVSSSSSRHQPVRPTISRPINVAPLHERMDGK